MNSGKTVFAQSAILPDKIDNTLKQLTKLAKYIYINEMTDSDDNGEKSKYWFKHDYQKLLTNNHNVLAE